MIVIKEVFNRIIEWYDCLIVSFRTETVRLSSAGLSETLHGSVVAAQARQEPRKQAQWRRHQR